jgi:hypothetical protein
VHDIEEVSKLVSVSQLQRSLSDVDSSSIVICIPEELRWRICVGPDIANYQFHTNTIDIINCLLTQVASEIRFNAGQLANPSSSLGMIQNDIRKTLKLDARSIFNYVKRLLTLRIVSKTRLENEFSSLLQLTAYQPHEQITFEKLLEKESEPIVNELEFEQIVSRPFTLLQTGIPFTQQIIQFFQSQSHRKFTGYELVKEGFQDLVASSPRGLHSTCLEMILNELLRTGVLSKKLESFGRQRQYRFYLTNFDRNPIIQPLSDSLTEDREMRDLTILALLDKEQAFEITKPFVQRLDQVK